MENIPLQAIPNQQMTIVLDENRWDLTIKTTGDTLSCTVMRNSALILSNARIVAGMRIIPSIYQEYGNFALVTLNEELPQYERLGISQFLIYQSQAELAAIRVAAPSLITEAFFNPLGALPLRFAPRGYVLAT